MNTKLIHAYTASTSLPSPSLREGLAGALECRGSSPSSPASDINVVLEFTDPEKRYDSAAYLVRHLITTFGRDAFMDFYREMDGVPASELRGALEETFGQDADELWSEALQADAWRVSACVCPSGSIPQGQPTDIEGGCGFFARRPFRVDGAPVRVDVTNQEQMNVTLRSCFSETWYPHSDASTFFTGTYVMEEGPVHESLFAILQDGRYFFRPFNRGKPVQVTVEESSALAEECSDTQPAALTIEDGPPLQVAVVADPSLVTEPFLGLSLSQPATRLVGGSPVQGVPHFSTSCNAESSDSDSLPGGDIVFGPVLTGNFTWQFELTPTTAD